MKDHKRLKYGELCPPDCFGCCGGNELAFAYCPDVLKNFEKELANLGYHKIGDDEIVIKKDEYETLKAQNDSLELSVKDLSYRTAQVAEANKLFAKRNDELLDELQGAIRIKEKTTSEILQKLKDYIENSVGGYLLIDRKGIRELAIELGIELGWDYE